MDSFFTVLAVVSVGVTVFAGVMSIANNPRSKTHLYLGFFLYSCALWSAMAGLLQPGVSVAVNTVIARLTFVAAVLLACTMYLFAAELTKQRSRVVTISVMSVTAVAVLLCLSPAVIPTVVMNGQHVVPVRTLTAYIPIIMLIMGLLGAAIVHIATQVRSLPKGNAKVQAVYVLVGMVAGTVIGVLTNVILPNAYPELHMSRFAWVPSLVWTLTLGYTMIRHRFLDIRLAIVRSVGYLGALVVAIGCYILLAAGSSSLLGSVTQLSSTELFMNALLIVAVTGVFPPLKRFFDTVTNRIFYRGTYDIGEVYRAFTAKLSGVDTLPKLCNVVVAELTAMFEPDAVSLYVVNNAGELLHDTTSSRAMMTYEQLQTLHEHAASRHIVTIEAEPYIGSQDTVNHLVTSHGYAIVAPLKNATGKLLGCVCLGPQKGRSYTLRDHQMIETIANELSITIEKLLSLEEINTFNEQLTQQINTATRQLRRSNKRLVELDATKDEFVSMASHQLRTPLTSVKGYISMVLEGDAGKITTPQRQLLTEAYTSSERMVHLIADFLNVSRLQTGKFVVDRHEADLANIVSQEVEGIRQIAVSHDITITYRKPTSFPMLYLDEGKIRQVIMNFIDNAIYYSPDSTTIAIKLTIEEGFAVLRVTDKGIGVPQDVQDHLFTKFFRAENARAQRPDGTGIGLYLAKRIIDGHKGLVLFESIPGKGSTFGFRLPIKKLSTPPPKTTPE
ncbi:MAG: ATP-binding protein [Candidatus Saccharimonas sp.]